MRTALECFTFAALASQFVCDKTHNTELTRVHRAHDTRHRWRGNIISDDRTTVRSLRTHTLHLRDRLLSNCSSRSRRSVHKHTEPAKCLRVNLCIALCSLTSAEDSFRLNWVYSGVAGTTRDKKVLKIENLANRNTFWRDAVILLYLIRGWFCNVKKTPSIAWCWEDDAANVARNNICVQKRSEEKLVHRRWNSIQKYEFGNAALLIETHEAIVRVNCMRN